MPESVLERQAKSFVDKGLALKEIRDRRLYREEFDSFTHYCSRQCLMTRQRAHQLIAAADVAVNLSTQVDVLQPIHERQVRPLTALAPERQRELWARAVAEATYQPRVWDIRRLVRVEQAGHGQQAICGQPPVSSPVSWDLYFRIENLAEQCRLLHRGLFAPRSRADLALNAYLAAVRGSRSLPRVG